MVGRAKRACLLGPASVETGMVSVPLGNAELSLQLFPRALDEVPEVPT